MSRRIALLLTAILFLTPLGAHAANVASWNFNEQSGTATDSSGNGNTGALMNGATRFYGAQNGNKLLLDGVDDYLHVPHHTSLDIETGDFSVALWYRFEPSQGASPLVIKQHTGATAGYALYISPDRKLALQGRDVDASVRYAETGSTVLQPDMWYFLVGVGDRTNGYRVYVNGVQEQTTRLNTLAEQDGTLSVSANLVVGANLNTGAYTKGRFDDVRVYNHALTQAEITAMHAAGGDPGATETRPNIVVIFTDDQEHTSLSIMPKVQSLLQNQGVTFSNSFVEFPVCCPSRSSFMTGQNATNHRVLGNEIETQGGYGVFQSTEGNALPVWLKNAGYNTAMIGKYLNGYPETSPTVPPGWDTWKVLVRPVWYYNYALNENGVITEYGATDADYQTDVLAQKAANYIASRSGSSQPFFLWLTPVAPHIAQTLFRGQNPEPAPRHSGRFAGVPLPQWASLNEADMSDKPLFMQQHQLADLSWATALYRNQRESLLAVDDMVETVVNALRTAGKLDNTIIVYTSDNGYSHGQHRRNNNKYLAYEESLRTPLVIRGPGVASNQTRSEMVTNLDIVATIVESAKATPGRSLDGRTLTPLFNGSASWRSAFFFEGNDQSGHDPRVFAGRYAGVRTPTAKYVLHETGEVELYDLVKDPHEMASVHNDSSYTGLKSMLAGILNSLRHCTGASCWYTGQVTSPPQGSTPYNPLPPVQTPSGPIQPQSVAKPGTATTTVGTNAQIIAALQAQVQVLLAQLAALQSGNAGAPSQCPNIARNLSRGSRGADVTELQQFLISVGMLANDSATGYFGVLTEAAVQKWQASKGIVSSGSPSTTGYGSVGPKTRSALLRCSQ